MSVEKLNEISELKSFKPTRKISDLKKEKEYQIIGIKILKTKFGKAVLCELLEYSIWLPRRYLSYFENANLEEYSLGKHYIIYNGLKTFGANTSPILKFMKKE